MELLLVPAHNNNIIHVPDIMIAPVERTDISIQRLKIKDCKPLADLKAYRQNGVPGIKDGRHHAEKSFVFHFS